MQENYADKVSEPEARRKKLRRRQEDYHGREGNLVIVEVSSNDGVTGSGEPDDAFGPRAQVQCRAIAGWRLVQVTVFRWCAELLTDEKLLLSSLRQIARVQIMT